MSARAFAAPTLVSVGRSRLDRLRRAGALRRVSRATRQTVTVEGARTIAASLLAKYAADSYSRPQVKLDDSLLDAGVLRIEIVEPRITEVRVSGDPGPHLERLESLGAELRDDGPVTQTAVATTLRRMRALPGLTLQATTATDAASEHSYRLDLDTEFDRVSGAVRLSNRGTDEAGPNFLLGQFMVNGLLGGNTNLGASFGAATDYDEYHGMGLLANVGVGSAEGRLSFSGFRSRSNPHELVDRDDSYLRDRVSIGFARPLPGFERATMSLMASLDLDDLAINRSGELLRDERLRMLAVGPRWLWSHGRGQYFASVEIVQGLDAFGSGLTALDLSEDPRNVDFTASRLTFTRLQRLGELWSVRLDALGQQSADILPYGERFKIGGDRLGRGFEVAEIASDHGIGAKVEVRRRLPNGPAALRSGSVYGFYDVGAAWKQDVPGRESAATAGVGFGRQGERVSGTVELAKPLTHPDVEGREGLSLFAEIVLAL